MDSIFDVQVKQNEEGGVVMVSDGPDSTSRNVGSLSLAAIKSGYNVDFGPATRTNGAVAFN